MNILRKLGLLLGVVSLVGLGASVASATPVMAADCANGADCLSKGTSGLETGGSNSSDWKSAFKAVTNTLLMLIGAVAVIMLVIGGFRYVISNGEQSQVANAKNTILYAIIGIVVAIFAYAIVNFIIDSLAQQ